MGINEYKITESMALEAMSKKKFGTLPMWSQTKEDPIEFDTECALVDKDGVGLQATFGALYRRGVKVKFEKIKCTMFGTYPRKHRIYEIDNGDELSFKKKKGVSHASAHEHIGNKRINRNDMNGCTMGQYLQEAQKKCNISLNLEEFDDLSPENFLLK